MKIYTNFILYDIIFSDIYFIFLLEVRGMQEKLSQVIDSMLWVSKMNYSDTTTVVFDEDGVAVYCDCGCDEAAHYSRGDGVLSADAEHFHNAKESGSKEKYIEDGETKLQCTAVPIEDGGSCVGVIITKTKASSNDAAMEQAEKFMDCIDQINNAIDMMSIHFENLFDKLQSMQEKTGFIGKGVEETSAVVSKIRANASKSKILALNASIEAARSGEAGKGFTVVAKEMGEMASASGTSASEINDALKSIFGHLDEITVSISDANELAEKQTGSISEIQSCLEQALSIATELGNALNQ